MDLEIKKISIPNRNGEKLVGVLHDVGSSQVVVLCHGFMSNKDCQVLLSVAEILTEERFNVFRFDFTGIGESEGTSEYGNYKKEVNDLYDVINHFYFKNLEPAAIVGHSKGGDVALMYASLYNNVPTIVNISGRFFLDRCLELHLGKGYVQKIREEGFIEIKDKSGKLEYKVTEDSLMELLSNNMYQAAISVDKECRVLTVHGSADTIVPVEDAKRFAALIPTHELQIIESANHGYTSHQLQLKTAVSTFMKKRRSRLRSSKM